MDLDVKPTIENVELLKKYVEKLPGKSPYLFLVKYEQQLVDGDKKVRALERVCTSQKHGLINKLEGLTNENWFRVSNITSLDEIPNNYFDIILWSDCDLESELRQVVKIYPKLKHGGRIYFDNLLSNFGRLLQKCLGKKAVKTFLGQNPGKVYTSSIEYAQLVRSVLANVFKGIDLDYTVRIISSGNTHYLVFIKGRVQFLPDADLADQLAAVDAKMTVKQKTDVDLSAKKRAAIGNRVFELIANSRRDLSSKTICRKLARGKLIPSCEYKGLGSEFWGDEHLKLVKDAIRVTTRQIDTLVTMGVLSPEEILERSWDYINPEAADDDVWAAFIERVAKEKIADLESYSEDESEDESEEDEFYPVIREPAQRLPAVFLPGLANVGGFSCFMDSVLFAILLDKGGYFERVMLNKNLTAENVGACSYFTDNTAEGLEYLKTFQGELKKLAAIVRGAKQPELTCYPIVQQMRKCDPLTESLMSGDQQDDSEFLRGLMQMFNLEPTSVTVTRAVSNDRREWTVTSERQERQAILEVPVPENPRTTPELLELYQRIQVSNYQNLPTSDWHKGPDGAPYQYSKEKHTINDSQALIFHIPRRIIKKWTAGNPVYTKNTSPVTFNEYVTNGGNQYYALQTITIHRGGAHGGHYTSFFKYRGSWFHYDDTADALERVRPTVWAEVLATGQRNGSLFMYYPVRR